MEDAQKAKEINDQQTAEIAKNAVIEGMKQLAQNKLNQKKTEVTKDYLKLLSETQEQIYAGK